MTQPMPPGSVIPGLGPAPIPAGVGSAIPGTVAPTGPTPQQLAQAQQQEARPTLSSMNEERAKYVAETKLLEEKHGRIKTMGAQAARGLMDAILAPGALVGMAAEGTGELTGIDALRDFGRDLGKASSGKELFRTVTEVAADSGSGNRVAKALDEQERAWPTLSTVSRLAGTAAVGLVGGATTVAPRALTGIALAGAEGAAGGAQYAYEDDAPLRDVLSASLLGGIAGAGLAGAAAGSTILGPRAGRGQAWIEAGREKLEWVAGKVGERARSAGLTVDQVGGKEAFGLVQELRKAKDFVANAVKNAGDNPVQRVAAEKTAREQISDLLARKAGEFDATAWPTKPPGAVQKFVFRSQILDQVSDDMSRAANEAIDLAPKLDFDVQPSKLNRLLKDADGPEAIGSLQQRIEQAFPDAPPEVGAALNRAASTLADADLPSSFATGHALVRELAQVASLSADDLTRQSAQRIATEVSETLGSDAFGQAGQLYRSLTAQPGESFSAIARQADLREMLRTASSRGGVESAVREQIEQIERGFAARAKLGGEALPSDVRARLKSLQKMAARAEESTTLDSGPVGRVLDYVRGEVEGRIDAGLVTGALSGAVEGGVLTALGGAAASAGIGGLVGGVPGMALGYLVSRAVQPRIHNIVSTVTRVTEGGLGVASKVAPRPLVDKSQREIYQDHMKRVERAAELAATGNLAEPLAGIAEIPPALAASVGSDMTAKIENLQAELPRPTPNIRGKAYEVLSASDVKRSISMIEATFEPMSVFDDFQAGDLDYQKLEYTWRQNPGLKQAVQAGIVDMLTAQLDDDTKAAIPDGLLTQLDYLGGFEGSLQNSIDRQFSSAMDAIGQQAAAQQQQAAQQRGSLQLPGAKPTFTQRIAQG
jgi:hypothetical protein